MHIVLGFLFEKLHSATYLVVNHDGILREIMPVVCTIWETQTILRISPIQTLFEEKIDRNSSDEIPVTDIAVINQAKDLRYVPLRFLNDADLKKTETWNLWVRRN